MDDRRKSVSIESTVRAVLPLRLTSSRLTSSRLTSSRLTSSGMVGSGLLAAIVMTLPMSCGFTCLGAEGSSKLLIQSDSTSWQQTRTKIQVEVEGQLLVDESTSEKSSPSRSIPLKAKATHDYFESVAFEKGSALAAARRYTTAKLENWVSGKSLNQSIREQSASTVVARHRGIWEQFCPQQPLDRKEVDLLRSPINTLALEKLLPLEPARIHSHWKISEEDARQLLNLEAVHQSRLKARVLGVDGGIAKLEIEGDVEGSADSVPTEIRIRGTAHVALGKQAALVTWLGVSIREKRAISKYRPGFEVTARLELIRKEQPHQSAFDRIGLIELAQNEDPSRWLVQIESEPGRFQTVANRNWVTYLDSGEDCVFRMIEDNQSIAQCNLSQLPSLDPGTQITAEALQAEIQAALGEHFVEFIETTEKLTGSNLRLLRIEVSGMQQQVPIRWIYAHLSDDSGRRLALVFTLAAEVADRFAGEDLQLLESLTFSSEDTPLKQSARRTGNTAR
jgi:hypothetical protein